VQAGLPKITLHGLRHSYASLHAAAGTPIVVVSKMLGHSSSSITADLYTHMFRSTAKDAANSAANLIPRTSLSQQDLAADASA
jgi:integrase